MSALSPQEKGGATSPPSDLKTVLGQRNFLTILLLAALARIQSMRAEHTEADKALFDALESVHLEHQRLHEENRRRITDLSSEADLASRHPLTQMLSRRNFDEARKAVHGDPDRVWYFADLDGFKQVN